MQRITATATAREIIEARLGRALGPIADMPQDLRDAMRLLGLQLVKLRTGKKEKPLSVREMMAR